jgi:hypothetical protein
MAWTLAAAFVVTQSAFDAAVFNPRNPGVITTNPIGPVELAACSGYAGVIAVLPIAQFVPVP